jgi:fucose permease
MSHASLVKEATKEPSGNILTCCLALWPFFAASQQKWWPVIPSAIMDCNHGILLDKAKHLTSYTLAFMIIGYLFGAIAIPKYISQEKTYKAVTILGVAITLVAMFVPGVNSVYCIAALGMANAMIWPGIWPLAIRGLGSLTNLGSSILIMGIIGGGVAPLLYGLVAKVQNPQIAYWVLIPFYLYKLLLCCKRAQIPSPHRHF